METKMTKFETGDENFDVVANAALAVLVAELDEDDFHYENNVENSADRVNNNWLDGDTVETLISRCR